MSATKRLGSGHLLLFNLCQSVGHALTLSKIVESLIQHKGDPTYVYEEAGPYARIFQYASILDTLHAVIGLVPSNPAMTLLQWGGKSNVLFLVVDKLPSIQRTHAVAILLTAWSISEVIRYPWYALTSLNSCPYSLTWLRYTVFIPLYPVGVLAEMWVLWQALPDLERLELYTYKLPNALNFAFNYATFVKVGLFVYVPMWWMLYSTLLRQRQKKLGSGAGTVGGKAKTE